MLDISLSPDMPALCCYGIVAILGAWVAGRQVSRQLSGIPGVWLQWGTLLLFAMYWLVPVGLFWLLDRSSAIADTSLFAAALVGLGYQQIIAGKSTAVRAGADLSAFWTPFQDYADSIEVAVRQKVATRQRRVEDRIIETIAKSEPLFSVFYDLARNQLADTAVVDAQMAEIEAKLAGQGTGYLRLRQTRLLYGLMMGVPDRLLLMYQKQLIDRRTYYLRLYGASGSGMAAPVSLILAALMVIVSILWWSDIKSLEPAYHLWRIGKPNTTVADQYRTEAHLGVLIADPTLGPQTVDALGALLRDPSVPLDRVGLILRILLENHTAGHLGPAIVSAMTDSLHTGNVDARRRIHDTLLQLATISGCPVLPGSDLALWKPADGDTPAMLEGRIVAWQRYWAATACHAADPVRPS